MRWYNRIGSTFYYGALCCLLFGLLGLPAIDAHGTGTLWVAAQPVGSYLLSAWYAPDPPQPRVPMHLTFAVADATSGAAIPNVSYQIALQHLESGTTVQGQATALTDPARLLAEMDLVLAEAGSYSVQLQVQGLAGAAETKLRLIVPTPSRQPTAWYVLAGILGLGAVGVFSVKKISTHLRHGAV